MSVDTRSFNILSLCAGVGGLDIGIRLAVPDARTVCFVEHEAYCCEVLATRMEDQALDEAPIWTDLRTFDGRPWRGVVDCVTAGYPCQPFSVAGKKRGTDDPRHLWPDVARVIRECEPTWVFCENVDRHLSVGFDQVSAELEGMGYVVAAGTFSAAEVGAPHLRKRLYFLARLDGGGGWPELADAGRGDEHADESGWGEREGGEGPTESERGGEAMADNYSGGREVINGQDWTELSSRQEFVGREPKLDDPNLPRSEGAQSTQRRDVPAGTSWELGDSKLSRLEGTIHSQGTEIANQRHRELESVFPPGPDETSEWSYLLERLPEALPFVCRDADGTPNRVDRLRAIGNGVLPLVAAYAFRTLINALDEEGAR